MHDISLLVTMGALLLAVGGVAGLLAGLLGVGGGIVLVPAFFYVFGMLGYDSPQLMQLCLGTSLATIIVTSIRSVLAHNKKKAVDWQILRGWAIGIACGALAGVFVAASLRSATLQFTFGLLAVCVGVYMTFGQASWRLGERMPQGVKRAILSPLMGLLSVLMGIGGGAFGVSIMTLHGVPIHRAVATAAGLGVLIAVPSVAAFLTVPVQNAPPWTAGAINLPAAGLVVAMTLITAPIGAAVAHKTNAVVLKRVFGVFLILMALNMLRSAAGW